MSKMNQKNLKCYGMYIDTAEVFLNIYTGIMDKLLDAYKVIGVYQDPDGQKQVLIYNSRDTAKLALEKAKSLGFDSAELCPTMIYVPESDVKNKDMIQLCEEQKEDDYEDCDGA